MCSERGIQDPHKKYSKKLHCCAVAYKLNGFVFAIYPEGCEMFESLTTYKADWYNCQLEVMEEMGMDDEDIADWDDYYIDLDSE